MRSSTALSGGSMNGVTAPLRASSLPGEQPAPTIGSARAKAQADGVERQPARAASRSSDSHAGYSRHSSSRCMST